MLVLGAPSRPYRWASHFKDEMSTLVTLYVFHTHHRLGGAPGRPPRMFIGGWSDLGRPHKETSLNLMVKINHLALLNRLHPPHYFAQACLSISGPVSIKEWLARPPSLRPSGGSKPELKWKWLKNRCSGFMKCLQLCNCFYIVRPKEESL